MRFRDNQARTQLAPLAEPATANLLSKDKIQFGYHSASGKLITITDDGLRAERMNPDKTSGGGVVYSSLPLKGIAEFEVKIVSYGTRWRHSMGLGVMKCKKGVPIESGPSIPDVFSHATVNHCVWDGNHVSNNLVSPGERSEYGCVDLKDLREEDYVGLHLSQDGVLEFIVNGESQGIAAKNIYTRDSDIYAFVDHYANCVATVITKAGEGSHNYS